MARWGTALLCSGPRPRAVILAVAGLLVTACSGPPSSTHSEVYPQVEFPFDRAVRKALAEVPDSKLFSVVLRQVSSPEPAWRTEVATKDGTVHLVRIDATLGRLLSTAVPADQSPEEKARTAALVEAAKVLPEEAAEKVAAKAMEDPRFGKVTEVRLMQYRMERLVWSVTVAAIAPEKTHTYQVDALSAKVVDSRTSETTS